MSASFAVFVVECALVVEGNRPNGGYDELDYTVHFLYDDTELASDPASMIGWILLSLDEVNAISNVIKALDVVFNKYGLNLTDKEYIEKDEWANVVEMAKIAKDIMASI